MIKNQAFRFLIFPYLIIYKIITEFCLGIQLNPKTKIGPNITIYHFQSTVINCDAVIGKNLVIRHCVTIGNKGIGGGSPILGDDIDIGCNASIIGDITIGDNVTIGAGAVVVKDVPPNCVIVGNPARILRIQ